MVNDGGVSVEGAETTPSRLSLLSKRPEMRTFENQNQSTSSSSAHPPQEADICEMTARRAKTRLLRQ